MQNPGHTPKSIISVT